jgi:hypothetical protein
MFDELPTSAAWRHTVGRDGFEVVFMRPTRRGWRFDGQTVAVEAGHPWSVRYAITVDDGWRTRAAHLWSSWEGGHVHRKLRADGTGGWEVDGAHVHELDGCLDVDLEASACTNTLPVHRQRAIDGEGQDAPAAYVRVASLGVERLEQRYTSRGPGLYDYEAPRFDFHCRLRYDRSGLVVDYPGIASRIA